jgi:hypothetical protein
MFTRDLSSICFDQPYLTRYNIYVYRLWSRSRAIYIKDLLVIVIQYISIRLKTHNIVVTIQEPTQVTTCCNLLMSFLQVSLNSRSARMSFPQVQRVCIVEHYLASRSYLSCQNEFRDTFSYSPVPNKSTLSRLVNRFRDTGSLQDRNRSGRPWIKWW